MDKKSQAIAIRDAATPIIKISGLNTGKKWKRNVAKGGRIGPWLQGTYKILDEKVWEQREPCLYLVSSTLDSGIRYVGISRNRLKDRWRLSPAYDSETMERLPERQIFHSQCWKRIEQEVSEDPSAAFEVRSIDGGRLAPILVSLGNPVAAFSTLLPDTESIVASIERWICNQSDDSLVPWNTAMTRKNRPQ